MWSDINVIKYTNIKAPCTAEKIRERIEHFSDMDVFTVSDENEIIGVIGCPAIDKDNRKFGIFYQFRKTVWGKGNGYEAAEWLLWYMKRAYGEAEIFADVVSENYASVRILEKLGFIRTDDIGAFERDGKKYDVYNYRLAIK